MPINCGVKIWIEKNIFMIILAHFLQDSFPIETYCIIKCLNKFVEHKVHTLKYNLEES